MSPELRAENLRWRCPHCGASIDLPRHIKSPKIHGQAHTLPEWKWHKRWLEHRCHGAYRRCVPQAPNKRYIVIPGHVVSWHDHQRHFISADRLMDLYGVRRVECVTVPPHQVEDPRINELIKRDGLIPLTPRGDGDYTLKTATQTRLF